LEEEQPTMDAVKEIFLEQHRNIVLASSSPRRKELLEKIGLKLIVDPGDFSEDLNGDADPEGLAELLSMGKAMAVAKKYPDALIIAADTFGVLHGKIIGKPHDRQEAKKMLQALSGKSHRVITGFTVFDVPTNKRVTRSVETRVYLKKLSAAEIENYLNSGEPLDKAGAYAIQGLGAVIVEKIVGDYYNVMGLPLSALSEVLKEFGVRIL
jgi:septum formation protein